VLDIIVEFSGWVKLSPEKAKFQKFSDDEKGEVITGVEWQKLTEDEQGEYIIEDVIAAQRDADDGSYEDITVLFDSRPSDFFFTRGNGTMSQSQRRRSGSGYCGRQEQIEEMLNDLYDVVIWSNNDAEIDRILPVVYWLEDELKEEKGKTDE